MKKVLFLLLLGVSRAFAQDGQHEVTLDKREMPVECILLGEKGFVVKTGNPLFGGKGSVRLLYFTNNGGLVWEKQIDNEYQALQSAHVTVAAPDGSVVYHIEAPSGFAGEKQHLTQINAKGVAKKMELAIPKDAGRSLQTIFCDQQYLYYLATENGNEAKEKKRGSEKMILNRFSHNGLTRKRIELDLPALFTPELSSFWSFAGQNKQGKYLVSKTLLPYAKDQTFDIVTIDSEGKVTGKKTITYEVGDEYIRPANSLSASEGKATHLGARNMVTLSFESLGYPMQTGSYSVNRAAVGITGALNAPFPAGQSYSPTTAAFGHMHVDPTQEENAIYLYGLLGPRPFRKLDPGYTGFYVYKYDLEGKEIWKLRQPATKEMAASKIYATHALPADRYIRLISRPNGQQTFSIMVYPNLSAQPDLFSFDISGQGQVTEAQSTGRGDGEPVAVAALTPMAREYVRKSSVKTKDAVPASFPTAGGEVLLLFNPETQKLNVLCFKE